MDRMTALLSIGELANRTGLPVRTIRFYSDEGVVPPADRTDAGYRLYGPDALARLGLVRTLRDLGLDLATIRRVLEREVSLTDVAAAHAAALDAQIRVLRVQKAVLQAVARRDSDPKELQKMHRLAQLSDDERKRIVADFLDQIFDGPRHRPRLRGADALRRARAARRPDARAGRRVDRARRARPGRRTSARRSGACPSSSPPRARPARPMPDMRAAAALVTEKAAPELAPDSAEAQAIVAEILPAFGDGVDRARARRPARRRHRRPRRALLAAAGDHQRLAAGPDHGPEVGVVHRRAARRRLTSGPLARPDRRRYGRGVKVPGEQPATQLEPQPAPTIAALAPAALDGPVSTDTVLSLQRSAGNAAVSGRIADAPDDRPLLRALARSAHERAEPPEHRSPALLLRSQLRARRLARSITTSGGTWDTDRLRPTRSTSTLNGTAAPAAAGLARARHHAQVQAGRRWSTPS